MSETAFVNKHALFGERSADAARDPMDLDEWLRLRVLMEGLETVTPLTPIEHQK